MATRSDHELASTLATSAGALLVEVQAELVAAGVDSQTLKDEGDKRSHDYLMALLAEHRPNDAVLSEEGPEDGPEGRHNLDRLTADRIWIIDPLDGTREFGEPPRTDWAVHVALVEQGKPTAGAVALPGLNITLSFQTTPPMLHASSAVGPALALQLNSLPTCWGANSSIWGQPAPRPWQSCVARPTYTRTPVASSSGTHVRQSQSLSPLDSMRPGWTEARCSTTARTPTFPIS